jgi:tRNA(Leu) C34 or U34 (ribose-2'-O)-methylase TrmL
MRHNSVAVAGVWELGWTVPLKEMELWEYTLRDFGVSSFHMAPITGIRSRLVQEKESIEEIIKGYRNSGRSRVVFVDEKAEASLKDFRHPENALYVFGRANYSPMGYQEPGDMAVKIETPKNKGGLWPHQAAAIILYDRYMK